MTSSSSHASASQKGDLMQTGLPSTGQLVREMHIDIHQASIAALEATACRFPALDAD